MDRNRQLGELWLEAFAAERGAADGTLKAFGEDLEFYLKFLGERGLTVGEVTQDIIRDYLDTWGRSGTPTRPSKAAGQWFGPCIGSCCLKRLRPMIPQSKWRLCAAGRGFRRFFRLAFLQHFAIRPTKSRNLGMALAGIVS